MTRIAAALVALTVAASPVPAQDSAFIGIATGGVTGVYYPAGGGICRFVNRGRLEHGVRCGVEATGGSRDNIAAIAGGTADFAVVQSDAAHDALTGADGATRLDTLRSVLALHPEPFTVVARADAGIAGFEDLKGKRVNIGNTGSGQRATMEVVMEAFGWTTGDFARAFELPTTEQTEALCDGTIDAMIVLVGHPSASVQQATTACDAVLVDVTGPEIDALLADRPYFRRATIPGDLYRGNPDDTETFGVGAVLVTDASQPDEIVALVVNSVLDELDQFRALHPAFARLDARIMATEGLTIPLHPSAERALRAAGLID
ncbi:TAXI family TRAP transporter solute-binding subunit [Palleronia sp. KMU-117]|uniref:TAXI family TRAP transporter solute-binding subunit n=1 Tax=Palleronia sp. KMU-117 TaxID=3434108 RepID=UPI003D721C81